MGTEFNIYDNGANPKKAGTYENIRKQLGVVIYVNLIIKESNIFGTKGPRKMKLLIPELKDRGENVVWKPINVLIKSN